MNYKVKSLKSGVISLILFTGLMYYGCGSGSRDYKNGLIPDNGSAMDKECHPRTKPECSLIYNPHIFDKNGSTDTSDIRSFNDCSIVFEAIYHDVPGDTPQQKCKYLFCSSNKKGSESIIAGDKTPCHASINKIDCDSCCLLSDKPIKKEQLPCIVSQ